MIIVSRALTSRLAYILIVDLLYVTSYAKEVLYKAHDVSMQARRKQLTCGLAIFKTECGANKLSMRKHAKVGGL